MDQTVFHRQNLAVLQLDPPFLTRRNGEYRCFEGFSAHILQQRGISQSPHHIIINRSRLIRLEDLSVHGSAVHPHHKVAHRCSLGQGEDVGPLYCPGLVIDECLIHAGGGYLVFYLDVHMVVFDGQGLVQAHIHSQRRIDDDDPICSCRYHQAYRYSKQH